MLTLGKRYPKWAKFSIRISKTELLRARSAIKMFTRDKSRPGAVLKPSLSRASLVNQKRKKLSDEDFVTFDMELDE